MKAAVLIPFNEADCTWRARADRWVTDRYHELHPDWPVIHGHSDRPWSKGAAVHDAYRKSDADILVIADADSFVYPHLLEKAVAAVHDSERWAMPHAMVYRLNQDTTERVYNGWTPGRPHHPKLARPAYNGVIGGGITVVHRTAYDTVGGIDPRFHGWGGEDLAFGWALLALVGLPHRGGGDLYHLWHPHALGDAADTLRGSEQSEALVAEYKAARRSPEAMREVLSKWTHPASSP